MLLSYMMNLETANLCSACYQQQARARASSAPCFIRNSVPFIPFCLQFLKVDVSELNIKIGNVTYTIMSPQPALCHPCPDTRYAVLLFGMLATAQCHIP